MTIERIPTIQAVEPSTNTFRVHRSTLATPLTSVLGFNVDNLDSFSECLVFNKLSELIEAPRVQPLPMFTPFASSDMFNVLQYNSISTVELLNNGFAGNVVDISLKPFLSARQFFKMSLGRFCAFGLKNSPQLFIPFHRSFHFVGEELFFGCNRYRVNSDINTNSISVATKSAVSLDIFRDGNMQKHPMFTIIDKVSRINIPLKILSVIFSNFDRYLYSTVDTAKRYFVLFETEASCIISYCKKLFKRGFRTLFSKNRFKRFTSFIFTATDKLCGKRGHITYGSIGCIMQNTLVGCVLFKSYIRYYLSRFGVLFHCFKKNRVEWYLNLHRSNSFHSNCNVTWGFKFCLQFLHPLKRVVSLEVFYESYAYLQISPRCFEFYLAWISLPCKICFDKLPESVFDFIRRITKTFFNQ